MINFLTGGLVSLLTEGAKSFITYKQTNADRKHELRCKELDFESKINTVRESSEGERLGTIAKTYKVGIKWVDSLNALIRPFWGLVCLFLFAKLTLFAIGLIISAGSLQENALAYEFALDRVAYFDSICDSIVGFFFVKRSFQK